MTLLMRDNKMREEERAEGRTSGRIEERIHTLLEFGKKPDECIEDIKERYGLSEEDAKNISMSLEILILDEHNNYVNKTKTNKTNKFNNPLRHSRYLAEVLRAQIRPMEHQRARLAEIPAYRGDAGCPEETA